MNTQVQTFESRVKEKLKDTIADLIPEKDLDRLVLASMESFKQKDLPELIKNELQIYFTDLIRAEFKKPEYAGKWNQQAQIMTCEAVEKIVIQNANVIFSNIIAGAAFSVIQNMQAHLPRY